MPWGQHEGRHTSRQGMAGSHGVIRDDAPRISKRLFKTALLAALNQYLSVRVQTDFRNNLLYP